MLQSSRRRSEGGDFRYLIVSPHGIASLDEVPAKLRPAPLRRLIQQEVNGRRQETVSPRVRQLLQRFGFEWEPASEPGHMRFLPRAAFMLERAKAHAQAVAHRALWSLSIPFTSIEGVSVVDSSSPLMRDYLALIANEPDIYGTKPYRLGGGDRRLLLRQTGCFQKFAISKSWSLTRTSLPVAVFELSDSYRREALRRLQLCARLRRFHLPELHIHTRNTPAAVELSVALHEIIVTQISEVADEWQLLISATHEFARSHERYLRTLAAKVRVPLLLKVYPPGRLCQDGVEVDVEYKISDATGCPREFSTFQIDERITRSFGLRCRGQARSESGMATIHGVLTSSVERYLYFAFDRIARLEAAGDRAALPLWLCPTAVRVVPTSSRAMTRAVDIADQLARSHVRADVDDRTCAVSKKIERADDELIPHVVYVDDDTRSTDFRVRSYESGASTRRELGHLIHHMHDERETASSLAVRLSRQSLLDG